MPADREPGVTVSATPASTSPLTGVGAAPGGVVYPNPGIICIVGHHKSGGTLLGVLLGTNPSVYYGGELYRFPRLMWEPGDPDRLCSCGVSALLCPFWSEVRKWSEDARLLAPLAKGQRRFERWGSAGRTLWRIRRHDPGVLAHARRMEEFARLIAAEARASVVVDQCPNALRGRLYQLLEQDGVPVHYVHLVRDGRGFLYSELAAKPGSVPRWQRLPFVVVARWVAMNVLTRLLCGTDRRRYLRIRYEDLVADPAGTLGRLGAFLGLDYSPVISSLQKGDAVTMRHVAAANRARLEGSIRLRADTRWQTNLSGGLRALFWLTAGWLARSYGYRRVAPAPA